MTHLLARLGPAGQAAVPALVTALQSAHPAVESDRERIGMDDEIQRCAARALGAIGPDAAEALPLLLDQSLGQSSVDVRDACLAAAVRIDPAGERLLPLLEKPLEDAFRVRDAVELLERLSSPAARQRAAAVRARWNLK